MNIFKKFNETKSPSKNKFFSSLKIEGISEKDYEKAKSIWNTFAMKTLGEIITFFLRLMYYY